MLLWADPPIKSYLSTLHGAKQLQTDQLFNEGRRIGGGGPGLMDWIGREEQSAEWLGLAPNAQPGRGHMAGTAGLAQQVWLYASPGLPGQRQSLQVRPASTLSLEAQD